MFAVSHSVWGGVPWAGVCLWLTICELGVVCMHVVCVCFLLVFIGVDLCQAHALQVWFDSNFVWLFCSCLVVLAVLGVLSFVGIVGAMIPLDFVYFFLIFTFGIVVSMLIAWSCVCCLLCLQLLYALQVCFG